MTIWEILANFGISYTLAVVSIGALIIGFISGLLSVLFVLQRRSIIGDAIAHSSLPGIGLAFLIILEKNRAMMVIGAIITAFLAVMLIVLVSEWTTLKEDTAIAIVLSLFFAAGITLLTYIQNLSVSAQAGLEHYLFGNISYLLRKDLRTIALLSLVVILVILTYWKEYKLILFNREQAITLGIPVRKLEALLMMIITLAVVLAIEMIGVVLIAGLLISPAVASRQWTHNYGKMMLLSGSLAAISGVLGAVTSSRVENVSPGPIIIVYLTLLVVISILFGSKNGYFVNWMHRNIFHRKVNHHDLIDEFIKNTPGLLNSDVLSTLEFNRQDYPDLSDDLLELMRQCGFCKKLSADKCALTYKGIEETEKFIKEVEL
ncbi:MAG: metal ABC transporter permease [Candidatus Heimdallarchaeota archaeon]|nr:metal ABC transporter permease [Candidatus Heimdallarchaeota archaeon]